MKKPKFAVLGAGCGGQTFAGHLASQGFEVKLYNRSPQRLGNLPQNPHITLEGMINAEGRLKLATTDIKKAVEETDILMVVTTANGHKDIACSLAPYLSDGQILILNPGRTFGSLEVAQEIYRQRPALDVTICEANTLLYATRVTQPGKAKVYGIKDEVTLSALRPERTKPVIKQLQPIFPQFQAAKNILETSLGNIGAVFHPTIMVFNWQRILRKETFQFYCEGATRQAVEFMYKLDKERIAVASALDTIIPSLEEWLASRYSLGEKEALQKLLQTNPSYQGIYAPDTVQHRYLLEDVPTGLVPLSLVGKSLGIVTSYMDQLISQAEEITHKNFYAAGRTLERLGLTPDNIKKELLGFVYPELKTEAA